MSDLLFETLLISNSAENRWYPTPIKTYKSSLKIDMNIENASALLSNLAYNLQYIEFLEKELAELHLSSVLRTMVIKSYVITGMSILEGLFTNIIKSNGWWRTSRLESLGTTQSNKTGFSGQDFVIKTEILKEVDTYMLKMNLDDQINVLNRHHEALSVSHLVYPALKRLKKLRNRVHLQKLNGNTDHDYNAFNDSVKEEMGKILLDILTSPNITDKAEIFDFLKVNK